MGKSGMKTNCFFTMKSLRRVVSLLCLALCLAVLPVSALAEEKNGLDGLRTGDKSAVPAESVGWVQKDGSWYYFGEDGRMYIGRHLIGDKFYYFGKGVDVDGYEQGVRVSGRVNNGFYDYFYDDDGVWQPGYVGENDTGLNMVRDGWQHSNDGTWFFISHRAKVKGWLEGGSDRYYLDPDSGAMVTGWMTIDGKTYYFRTKEMAKADKVPAREGSMVAGCSKMIDGTIYTFDKDGVLQDSREDK